MVTAETSQNVRLVKVTPGHAGQRLDNYLLGVLKGVPRSRIYRLLRRGEVRVNRGRRGPDYRLQVGDEVRIPPVRQAQREQPRANPELARALGERVLYEDAHLLVLDKPSGLAVHGGSGQAHGLVETLRSGLPGASEWALAHRLDRETSGCLLIAKDRASLLGLHAALREGAIRKRYLALVLGQWPPGKHTLDAPLARRTLAGGERGVGVSEEGKAARTVVRARTCYAGATLVSLDLDTGRMHQARVHLAHAGHPVAGDPKYGDRAFNRRMRALGLRRLFLHAAELRLQHPVTGKRIEVRAPLPAELAAVTGALEQVRDEAV